MFVLKYLIDFIVLALLYILVFFRRWRAIGKDILLVNTLMYVYLSFVLYFTLMPVITSLPFILNHPYSPMNMTPFVDVLSGRGDFIRQVLLNVIMTIPFGFLFPMTRKPNAGFGKTVFSCLIMSLGIELLQPLINGFRSADITDLITNTIGSAIGYVVYVFCRPIASLALRWIEGKK